MVDVDNDTANNNNNLDCLPVENLKSVYSFTKTVNKQYLNKVKLEGMSDVSQDLVVYKPNDTKFHGKKSSDSRDMHDSEMTQVVDHGSNDLKNKNSTYRISK